MSNTEFIRKAIDFYDSARLSSYTAIKINMIDDCIGALNVFRENVKNSDENTFNLLRENVKSVKGFVSNRLIVVSVTKRGIFRNPGISNFFTQSAGTGLGSVLCTGSVLVRYI